MLLLNPIWLFALAAIGIPVVIHLWNIRLGKTLKVGSISLFSESSPKSSRSFKVQDILLLILRCLLLMLLAVLLATPLWQQRLIAGNTKGWLLIPPDNFRETYRKFKPSMDSLTNKGYEFHSFNPGFAKGDLKELLKDTTKQDTVNNKIKSDYWSLCRQLSGKVPHNVPIEMFTPNGISHFTGDKPESALNVNWHTYIPADSVSTWLAGAWLTANGNVQVMQGTATPSGISYQYTDIQNGGQSGSAYAIGVENGSPVISIKNVTGTKIKVDTATLHIAIYTDNNTIDAGYLKAALDAVSQATRRKSIIRQYNQPNLIPPNQDWLFWLSEKPVDAIIAQKTKHLFVYETGKVNNLNSWINNSDNYTIKQGAVNIPLYKSIAPKITVANTVWTDSFGNPILSLEQGKTVTYHFYSRFNPAWNDLVWSDTFPKWMLELTTQTQPIIGGHERRIISTAQLMPVHADSKIDMNEVQTHNIDLTRYLWLTLALLFFTERWLATRNQNILANG